MARAKANGIEIEYETFGDGNDPTILLIMGLGGQLTLWPDSLCSGLAGKGFQVVRYDNRDVGLSTRFDAAGVPNMKWLFVKAALGLRVRSAYTLADMAADGMALLDHLGARRAHIVGVSMGGMNGKCVLEILPDMAAGRSHVAGNRFIAWQQG